MDKQTSSGFMPHHLFIQQVFEHINSASLRLSLFGSNSVADMAEAVRWEQTHRAQKQT